MLAETGLLQEEIATRTVSDQSTVARWLSGEKSPGLANRRVLLAKFKIPIESWDEAIETTPTPATTPEWGERTAEARAKKLEAMLDKMFVEFESKRPEMTQGEATRTFRALTAAENEIRKLRGEGASELQIMRHPKWYELKELVLEALDDHPKALADVIHAIEEAERRSA